MKKVRDSNYELMRILAMFSIVLWHTIINGEVFDFANMRVALILRLVLYLCIVHVNLFVLLMGYYQVKNDFNIKKIFNILLEILFYNIIINVFLKYTGIIVYKSNIDFLEQTLFFNLSSYWFIAYYLILYMLSPFINKFLYQLDKRKFKQLLICIIFINCILPLFTKGLFYVNDGFSIFHFVTLYIIGAYLSIFKINNSFLKKINIHQKRLIYLLVYLLCAIFNLSLYYLAQILLSSNNDYMIWIGELASKFFVNNTYNPPIVLVQSIVIFLLFGTFNFSNKIINYISSLMFGVYLIHESYYLQSNEYRFLNIENYSLLNDKEIITRIFARAMIVFFGSLIIESLRKLLFCLLDKVKWIKDIKEKFINWVNKLIEIN